MCCGVFDHMCDPKTILNIDDSKYFTLEICCYWPNVVLNTRMILSYCVKVKGHYTLPLENQLSNLGPVDSLTHEFLPGTFQGQKTHPRPTLYLQMHC